MYPYCVITHLRSYNTKTVCVLRIFCFLKCVWTSTQNNGCKSYSFRVIKILFVNFFLVELKLYTKMLFDRSYKQTNIKPKKISQVFITWVFTVFKVSSTEIKFATSVLIVKKCENQSFSILYSALRSRHDIGCNFGLGQGKNSLSTQFVFIFITCLLSSEWGVTG